MITKRKNISKHRCRKGKSQKAFQEAATITYHHFMPWKAKLIPMSQQQNLDFHDYQHVSTILSSLKIHSFNRNLFLKDQHQNIVAIVRAIPFDNMHPDEHNQLNFLVNHLLEQSHLTTSIKNKNTLAGKMWGEGWRKAMESGPSMISRYSPHSTKHQDPGFYAKVTKHTHETHQIDHYLGTRFYELANQAFEEVQSQLAGAKGTSISSLTWQPELQGFQFASNVTFTYDGFCNRAHVDNDQSTWSYGLFMPINKQEKKLARNGPGGFQLKGGQFFFNDFNVAIDFGAIDGVFEIAWKASQHRHQTLPSSNPGPEQYTRLGLSCQITKKAFKEFEKYRNYSADDLKGLGKTFSFDRWLAHEHNTM